MEQKLAQFRLTKLKDKAELETNSANDQSVSRRKPSTPPKDDEAESSPQPAGMTDSQSGSSFAGDRASLLTTQDDDKDFVTRVESLTPKSRYDRYLYLASILLQLVLWTLLMVIFVKLEFGAVFFVISLLYILWSTLRNRPKKEGEPSAYSVFNPNCERIDGTLTAEQFEREIRFQT